MSFETIYSRRIELSNWEIDGIILFLQDHFGEDITAFYSDKAIHLETNNQHNIAFFLIGKEDLYATDFVDDSENVNYRYHKASDIWWQIDDSFNHKLDHETLNFLLE